MIRPMKVSFPRLGKWKMLESRLDANSKFTDMFRALLKTDLPKEHIFACTVGASSKRTLASWHLLEPSDVIASVAALIKAESL